MQITSNFHSPTQLPTQGQWWSNLSTQLSHIEQWEARGGLKILQVKQYFSFTDCPFTCKCAKGVRKVFVNKYLYFVIFCPDLRKVPTLTTHISFNSSEESNLPATLLELNLRGSKEIAKGANIQELTKGPNLYWPSVSLNSPGLRKTLQLL